MILRKSFAVSAAALGLALAIGAVSNDAAIAKGEPSQDKCAKFKKGSADWKKCAGQVKDDLSDQDLYYAGYWLARTGQYAEALGYLTKAKQHDERVLTYIGFATRKLGDVEGAMQFYDRALALNPNYTVARAYLGEAFLGKGDAAAAKRQLREIAVRCSTSCPDHVELEAAIAKADIKG